MASHCPLQASGTAWLGVMVASQMMLEFRRTEPMVEDQIEHVVLRAHRKPFASQFRNTVLTPYPAQPQAVWARS